MGLLYELLKGLNESSRPTFGDFVCSICLTLRVDIELAFVGNLLASNNSKTIGQFIG